MTDRRHLLACLLLGCNGSSETPSAAGSGATEPATSGGFLDLTAPDSTPPTIEPAGVVLPRGAPHQGVLTEIWLDPRASAALSLDALGGVRLWPTLPSATEDLAGLAPIRVPLHEPTSLSLARAGERAFVIAALDTIQAGRVIRVEVDDAGQARMRERFAIPPDDPLLELHVFDGGERLLALGVDHRLTLYDGDGKRVAELAEYGLAPWQLRVAGTPESPQLAMILVGPTRIQRLSIADDRIAPIGEPRPFTLDRGPNHNDLALLPSGRTAAVFRRPKPRGTQWSLELHELETGEVRVLWGEVESNIRPRLHIVDDRRALLEDGSGSGFWIELDGGVVMPTPFELPEELEALPPESRVTARRVGLPESTQESRRRASVVAGLRVVPAGSALIVDPLDADHHHRLTQELVNVERWALDHDGGQLVLVLPESELVVESLGDGRMHPVVGCEAEARVEIAFTDPDHLLLVDGDKATICAWRTGQVVSTIELPSFDALRVRVTEPGSGQLAISSSHEDDEDEDAPPAISRVVFADNELAALEPVRRDEVVQRWPELANNPKLLALDGQGRRYSLSKVGTREFDITPSSGEPRSVQIADSEVEIERFEPNADGTRVAIVHRPAREDGYGYSYSYSYYDPPTALSMWAIEDEAAKQLWSIPTQSWLDLAWSGDGSRLALERTSGVRVITADGELVTERQRRELELERLPDPPASASAPTR